MFSPWSLASEVIVNNGNCSTRRQPIQVVKTFHRKEPAQAAVDGQSCIWMNNASTNRNGKRRRSSSIARAIICLSIIVSGLTLRAFGLGVGLPAVVVKFGGSVLWGAMVFFLVALAAKRLPVPIVALIAAAIATVVELFRLVHAPWLDSFRLTLAGALLLGRIFSPWDMLAYGVGISLGVLLDRFGVSLFKKAQAAATGTLHSAS
jgi:hypothetical protein